MLVLLTGIPAVGKTSVAQALHTRDPERFQHTQFASIVLNAVRDRRGEPGLTYDHLRAHSFDLVTAADIATATAALLATAAQAHDRVVLVDSHAISKEHYGYRATPDSPEVLHRFRYGLIVHLFADPATMIERSSNRRYPVYATERDVILLEQLQMSTSIYYAGTAGCHLHLVDAAGSLEHVTVTVEELLRVADQP